MPEPGLTQSGEDGEIEGRWRPAWRRGGDLWGTALRLCSPGAA